jgi:hypothetical protein
MVEIFHDHRDHLAFLDDPERSEVALRATVLQIGDSGLSPEDQAALIGEAKAESLMFGLDTEVADRTHKNAGTSLAFEHLDLLMDKVREVKENRRKEQ